MGWQKKGSSFERIFFRTHDITTNKSTIEGFYGRAKFSRVMLEILKSAEVFVSSSLGPMRDLTRQTRVGVPGIQFRQESRHHDPVCPPPPKNKAINYI